MPFQNSVNNLLPVGVEGKFASDNFAPTYPASQGAFRAGTNGLTVGHFAWINADGVSLDNTGSGAPDGFVGNNFEASIVQWLDEASLVIQPGVQATLFTGGDFWVKTATAATVGQKVFASTTDGSIQTAAAGATVSGFVETPFKVASAGAVGDLIKASTWS